MSDVATPETELEIRDLIDSGSRSVKEYYILSREEFELLKREYREQRNLRAANPNKLYFQLQSSTKFPDNEICVISRPQVQDYKQIEAFMTIVIIDDDDFIAEKKASLVEKRAIADALESSVSDNLSSTYRDYEEEEIETTELLTVAIGKRTTPRKRKVEVVK